MTDEKKAISEKPLDKMTVTELREVAKEIPELTGVHGMKKAELLEAISASKGIEIEPTKKAAPKPKKKKVASVKELKGMIKSIRAQRVQALADKDAKMAKIYRRRISRLKRKTRMAA